LQDKRFAVGFCGIGCETDRSGYDRKNSNRSQARRKYALRDAGNTEGQAFEAKMVLTLDGVDMEHVVTGTIKGHN
jgi:hypothetical protein